MKIMRETECRPARRKYLLSLSLLGALILGFGACQEGRPPEKLDSLALEGDGLREGPATSTASVMTETHRPSEIETHAPPPTDPLQSSERDADPTLDAGPTPRPTFTPGPTPTLWPTSTPHPALASLPTPEYDVRLVSTSPDGRWTVRAGRSETQSYRLKSESGIVSEEWLLHRRMLVIREGDGDDVEEEILSDWTREAIGTPNMEVHGWTSDSRYLVLYDMGIGDGCGGSGGPLFIYSTEQKTLERISSSDYAVLPTQSDDGWRLAFVEQGQLVQFDLRLLEGIDVALPMKEYRPMIAAIRFLDDRDYLEVDLETDICSDEWLRHTFEIDMRSGASRRIGDPTQLDFGAE